MNNDHGIVRRLRLRHVAFLTLLLSGIIPLGLSSLLLSWQNRALFEEQEKEELLRTASHLSQEIDGSLGALRRQLIQLGDQLLTFGPGSPARLRRELGSDRFRGHLERRLADHPELVALTVFPPEGETSIAFAGDPVPEVGTIFNEVFEQAFSQRRPIYRFVLVPGTGEPAAALAVPISLEGGEPRLVVVGLQRVRQLERVLGGESPEPDSESQEPGGVFLLWDEGSQVWSRESDTDAIEALVSSGVARELGRSPVNQVTEYQTAAGVTMLAQVSRVQESGWSVLVQRPAAAVFQAVDRMVLNTLLSSVVLVGLALLFALVAARRLSQPIQRLAESSHEIAAGSFGHRVPTAGLLFELADLGRDFNRMSAHVERYVEQLRRAAQENRELFIGSLRAFAAAIDAKDPYTRGHSERVAKLSRTIARHLGFTEEQQEKVWIAALLHDVGKLGVDDRVLQKVGELDDEEFELMKRHPGIGAEILAPIQQLKEMIPAVRWHHENWNGRGYPDGLKGEEIPLYARIVAVADTFDAVTTTRPYQQAYTLEFAVETITRLTGSRFDAKVVTSFLGAYEKGEIRIAPRGERAAVRARSESEVEARVLSMT